MGKVTKLRQKNPVHVFQVTDNECIWMKAGVVNFRLCDRAYDCLNCPFDKAMSSALRKKPDEVESWRRPFQQQPYNRKECRHMLSGRVPFRLCGNSYQCHTCEFDQSLEEQQMAMPPVAPHLQRIAGFYMADDYYYHRGHSWARLEHGGLMRVGIDDFTQRLFGCMSEVRLPKLGAHIKQMEPGWVLRREDKLARMLAPAEGVVVARNHKVIDNPNLVKEDPYGDGWLLLVEPKHLKQNLQNLLFADEAAAWLSAETAKLEAMTAVDHDLQLAATGGEIVEDIYGSVEHLKWDELVHEFLLT